MHLTVWGACIVIYSCDRSQHDVLFLNVILINNSTCFRQTYCPSSGVLILNSQQVVFVILFMLTVCYCCEYSIKTPDDREIHPNIIHPSMPRSPQWSLSFRFPHQDPIQPLSSPICATCPAHLILLDFITRTILGVEYKSFSSSLCNNIYLLKDNIKTHEVLTL